jgi:C1A family cysteine protease
MSRTGKITKYISWALSAFALMPGVNPIHAGGDTEVQASSTIQAAIQPPIEEDPIGKYSSPLTSLDISSMKELLKGRAYTFTIGENEATHYSLSELCGFVPPTDEQKRMNPPSGPAVTTGLVGLPAQWDWRSHGGDVTIRRQGGCGSCWAFATVGALECNIKIKDGKEVDLSEQYLVSCNNYGYSCSGGELIHKMHVSPGAVMESCFPYTGTNASCKTGCEHPYRIESYGNVAENVDALKSAIYQYGPLAVCVAADSYFQAYTGGVFNRNSSGNVNHCVVLVGWDDSTKSWIMRNSWGSGWGEGGYMRIAYGCNRIGSYSEYANYKGGTPPPSSFALTVNSGSGDGNYAAGAKVTITANAAPSGQVFSKWVINSGSPTLANPSAATTTLTMPASAATVTATYISNNNGGPAGFTWCAKEGGSYTFTTKVDVAYGANGKFNYKYGVTGKIRFDNATFGDPVVGIVKSGYYKNAGTEATLTLSKPTYAVNEKIVVTYANLPGNYTDWISIFKAGAANTQYMQWFYTKGAKSGTMTFNGLAAGQYEMRLFYNDSYTLVKKVSFTVK